MFPNDIGGYGEVFDDFINPFVFTGNTASGLGNAMIDRDPKALATEAGMALGAGALGFDPLGGAMKAIPNTYKINPWAYKPAEGMMFRGLGEEGYQDALQSGIFRSKQNVEPSMIGGLNMAKSFGTNPYFTPKFKTAESYGSKYLAEVPESAANWRQRYKRTDWSQVADRAIPINEGRILQKDWLQGYKPVEIPTTNITTPVSGELTRAGVPNPLALLDQAIPRPFAPGHFLGMEDSWNNYSPLNLIPGYGKKLSVNPKYVNPSAVGFRKFGNSLDDVIDSQSLRPAGTGMGSSQIKTEGNWAEVNSVNENYPGVFEATMDPNVEGSNILLQRIQNRNGILGRLNTGGTEIPLTDVGLSFNRRLPFSNRYVPIDKSKLANNEFQLATQLPHLQSLAEKYGLYAGGAGAYGYLRGGEEGAKENIDLVNKYTIDPVLDLFKEDDGENMKTLPKEKNGGWLEKYNDGGPIQPNYNDSNASAGPGFQGDGYSNVGRNYSPAWGGQFAMGGALPGATGSMYARVGAPSEDEGRNKVYKTDASAQNGTELENAYAKWPALRNMGPAAVNKDYGLGLGLGYGGVEFMHPNLGEVNYDNGVLLNQSPGKNSTTYNPLTDDAQSVRLDMLHGMHQDPTFSKQRDAFKQSVLSDPSIKGDMNHWYNEDKKKGRARDGRDQWMNNYIDGQMRTLLFEGDRKSRNYSDKEANQLLSNPKIKKSFNKLNDYLKTGYSYGQGPRAKNGKKVIKDDRGQWAHPGEITEIGSNQITMQGVPYPVMGISDTGDMQIMYPNQEYQYDGDSVTEYPMMAQGGQLTKLDQLTNFTNYNTKQPGGWLDKYQ